MVLEVNQLLHEAETQGASRLDLLRALARTPGVYVPRFYEWRYEPDGTPAEVFATDDAASVPVVKRFIQGLPPILTRPIVPLSADRSRPRRDRNPARLHPGLPLLSGRHDLPSRCANARPRKSSPAPGNSSATRASTTSRSSRCPPPTTRRSSPSSEPCAPNSATTSASPSPQPASTASASMSPCSARRARSTR